MATRKRQPWFPVEYDKDGKGYPGTFSKEDIRAVQSLADYAKEAIAPQDSPPPAPSPHEVKRALDWIINHACLTFDEPFQAGSPDITAYLLGRRSAGLAIIKLMKWKVEILDRGHESQSE